MGECDVAIIGAGIIGASIAYEMAARGASVSVLDSRPAGQGATQAAAGMLAPYIEGLGKPILDMAARSLTMYDEFVSRIATDSGMMVDYHREGSLQVITADGSVDELVAFQKAAVAAGVCGEMLDALQIRELEPLLSRDVVAGVFIGDHGVVVPESLLRAVAAAGLRLGARFETARVERLTAREGAFQLHTRGETLSARRVIVAAGSWSGGLAIADLPPLPVRPVRGQLLHLMPAEPALRHVIWGERCYLAPAMTGPLAVGATMEEAGFDERTTAAGVHGLLAAAGDLVPALWRAGFTDARVGLRPATPDGMPIMGRSLRLPGLFFATGHFRNGILLAPLTARVISELVLEDRDDPVFDGTSPQRFGEY